MEIIDILQEEHLVKIDGDKLGKFYIVGGVDELRQNLYKMLDSLIGNTNNPDSHKHYVMAWKKYKYYYIVYYSSSNDNDLFPNFKSREIKLSEVLRGKYGLAVYNTKKSTTYRLQPKDTRNYKIEIPYSELKNAIIELLKTDHSLTFIDSIKSYDQHLEDGLFYRGHTSYNYKLLPSLFRGDHKKNEIAYFDEFKNYCKKDLIGKNDYEVLTYMQHYGLPTRLLDITDDRYVALFMACTNIFGEASSIEDIGEVFSFKEIDSIEDYNSETISELVALTRKSTEDKEIKEVFKKPHFIEYKDIEENQRLSKQRGSFILFGFDDNPSIEGKSVYVINKIDILKELDKKGYNEMSLVPEMEHICHYIKQKYELA